MIWKDEIKAREEEFLKLKEDFIREEKLRKDFEEQNIKLLKEKSELYGQLQSEREHTNNIEERLQKLIVQKSDLESQLSETEEKLLAEEAQNNELLAKRKQLETDLNRLNEQTESQNISSKRAEADIKNKDTQIARFQAEVARFDDLVANLDKEKVVLQQLNAKLVESVQAEETRSIQLAKIKSKLEQTVSDQEASIDMERKQNAALGKLKSKLEVELKELQCQLTDFELTKQNMSDALTRKEQEFLGLVAKCEEEQSSVSNLQRKLKELVLKLDGCGEEIDAERQARFRVEKQRLELARELEELKERLEERGDWSSAHNELNRRREGELVKLRQELDAANSERERAATDMKKKHQEGIAELVDQIDQLQRSRGKLEKEKQVLRNEVEECEAQIEHVNKAKVGSG